MPFHIRDPETDALLRELARRRGTGLTEAVRGAVRDELERDDKKLSLWERTADMRAEIASWLEIGLKADETFND